MISATVSGREQPAQREVLVPGPGLGQRHVRRVGGRRQRVDLGQQLGGGRQAGERRGDGTGRRGYRRGGAAGGQARRRTR